MQIVARRAAGEPVPVISQGLHLTLLEVREVLRATEAACPVARADQRDVLHGGKESI